MRFMLFYVMLMSSRSILRFDCQIPTESIAIATHQAILVVSLPMAPNDRLQSTEIFIGMCVDTFSVRSFFTDAEFCFLGADLRRYTCWCPISTCGVDAYGNAQCQFTGLTFFVFVTAVLLGVAGVLVYLHAASEWNDLHLKDLSHNVTHRYRDVLFGVYHASDDNPSTTPGSGNEIALGEKKPLMEAASTGSTNGGTFAPPLST